MMHFYLARDDHIEAPGAPSLFIYCYLIWIMWGPWFCQDLEPQAPQTFHLLLFNWDSVGGFGFVGI